MRSGKRFHNQSILPAIPVLLLVSLACVIGMSVTDITYAAQARVEENRPKVGLVLSGGGARGFAHIGVLKKLEELNIPIDYVVGTSMGSIVGGLYALGLTPDEIEDGVKNIEWDLVFNDYAKREFRSFRRKQDDYLFTSQHRIGVSEKGLQLSPGLIEGQHIEVALDRLAHPGFHITDFDQLRIPYRAIATDIETGDAVILGEGNLAKAMRASMSIPGALPPVKHNGKLLVDGGIGNNVPIDVARDMGADIVIVVDVSAPLATKDNLSSSFAVTGQLTTILTRRVADLQIKTLHNYDVLIVPGREDLSSASFNEYAALVQEGTDSANRHLDELENLSLNAGEYQYYRSSLRDVIRHTPVIDAVEVKNQTRLDNEIISRMINQQLGKPLDVEQLERDLLAIYGLDLSSTVVYDLVMHEDKTTLVIYVRKREWAPTYLQIGFTLRTEFDIGANANFDFVYTNPAINRLGGEFRATAAAGSEPRLTAGIYQPIDKHLNFFVSADAGFLTTLFPVVSNNNNVDNVLRFHRNIIDLSVGRIFERHSELRLSLFRSVGRTKTIVGQSPNVDSDFDEGGLSVRLLTDTQNNVDFPTRGVYGKLQWRGNREDIGADLDYDQVMFELGVSGTWGKNTIHGRTILETTVDENAPFNALYRRGGFFEVSGTIDRELSGQHFSFIGGAIYRRLGNISLLPMYAGVTLEAGNAWDDRDDASLSNSIFAGSAFIGADTFLGPVYLAYGINDANDSSIYFYLGRRWTHD